MIQFNSEAPPLLSDDHQEPIIHVPHLPLPLPLPLPAPAPAPAPPPAMDDDVHVSWLNPTMAVIQFNSEAPRVTDRDLPPLLCDDHQEPIIHVPHLPLPLPALVDDVHASWLNPTIPVNAMNAEDESWMNPTIPVNDLWSPPCETAVPRLPLPLPAPPPVPAMDDDVYVSWLNPTMPVMP